MLTPNEIHEAEQSRLLLRHIIDAEPVNKKGASWEIVLWALDELTRILVKDGKYVKPTILNFRLFKLASFAVALIKKINFALKQPKTVKTTLPDAR